MWGKATSATLDWSGLTVARRMRDPLPFGFEYLEDILVMPVTRASREQWELEGINEGLPALASNWNKITNTSGTLPALAVSATDLHVDLVCGRNLGIRPWLDELSEIRLPTLKVFGEPSSRGLAIITDPITTEVEGPAASLRQQEIKWLSSNARKLGRYEGKWIALEGDKIVASGSDEVAVEMRARMKGIKVPFLIRVPSKEDMLFIGHSLYDSNGIR